MGRLGPMSLEDAITRVRIATGGRLRDGNEMDSVAEQLVELIAGLHELDTTMANAALAPASATEPATIFHRPDGMIGNDADGQ
jgi:hypothetical protein